MNSLLALKNYLGYIDVSISDKMKFSEQKTVDAIIGNS